MSFTGKKSESSGSFEQPDPGLQAAVLIRIVDWGTQDWGNFGPKRRVQFVWEVAQEVAEGEHKGDHLHVSKMYTLSFNQKSNLMGDLESWRGRAYDPGDEIDLETALGKPCMLTLVAEQKGEYLNVNVKSVSAMPQGMLPITPDAKPFSFNFDDPDWDNFAELPQKTQDKLAITAEYKTAMGLKAESSKVVEQPSGARHYTPDPAVEGNDFDDDIPF